MSMEDGVRASSALQRAMSWPMPRLPLMTYLWYLVTSSVQVLVHGIEGHLEPIGAVKKLLMAAHRWRVLLTAKLIFVAFCYFRSLHELLHGSCGFLFCKQPGHFSLQ